MYFLVILMLVAVAIWKLSWVPAVVFLVLLASAVWIMALYQRIREIEKRAPVKERVVSDSNPADASACEYYEESGQFAVVRLKDKAGNALEIALDSTGRSHQAVYLKQEEFCHLTSPHRGYVGQHIRFRTVSFAAIEKGHVKKDLNAQMYESFERSLGNAATLVYPDSTDLPLACAADFAQYVGDVGGQFNVYLHHNGQLLGFYQGGRQFAVPAHLISGFRLTQAWPAKGGGGFGFDIYLNHEKRRVGDDYYWADSPWTDIPVDHENALALVHALSEICEFLDIPFRYSTCSDC